MKTETESDRRGGATPGGAATVGTASGGVTRREFLARGGASAMAMSAASYARASGANERVRAGWIGVGNRGESLLRLTLEHLGGPVQPVAVCDVYEPYRAHALSLLEPGSGGFTDYRRLLESKDVDAVVIATPDHWHAKMFTDACRAGKDVYVEKPLSLTVSEGRTMTRVAAETGRVTQMGAQRHTTPYIVEACGRMRAGEIGAISRVRCFHIANESPNGIGRSAPGGVPDGLDWDMWLGPAPAIPFDELVWNYKFRWFWDYSGGQMTNFGAHWIDVIHMALGQDRPRAVTSLGGRYVVADDRQVPDTMEALWEYDNCLVSFGQINGNAAPGSLPGVEIEFRGTKGTLYLSGRGYEIVPEAVQAGEYPARGPLNREAGIAREKLIEGEKVKGGVDHAGHLRDFFDCVKSREKCALDAATGHMSTVPCLIANIAQRVRATLEWDADAERFTNNETANRMLQYPHRAPWTL